MRNWMPIDRHRQAGEQVRYGNRMRGSVKPHGRECGACDAHGEFEGLPDAAHGGCGVFADCDGSKVSISLRIRSTRLDFR